MKTRVAVCVITYNRPEGLRRLLDGLDALTFADSVPDLNVVLVDNDPSGMACVPYARTNATPAGRWPLGCHVEPRRGIPYARNRALAGVDGGVDFVAFIDDDEVPEPSWLDELLRVQRIHDADVVAGPVLRRFDAPPPEWVREGRFFEKPRHETGAPVKFVDTANSLVRREVLEKLGLRFDERLALNGGDDTHLFLRIHEAGHRMVWADGAVVRESVPVSRANAGWLLKRAYRLGNSLALIEADLYPSLANRALRLAKALARMLRGALSLPFSAFRGRHGTVKALQDVCRGAGMISGLAGSVYEEYGKTHGT